MVDGMTHGEPEACSAWTDGLLHMGIPAEDISPFCQGSFKGVGWHLPRLHFSNSWCFRFYFFRSEEPAANSSFVHSGDMECPVDIASTMTSADLKKIRCGYWLAGDIKLRVLSPEQRVMKQLESGALFYEESLRAGLRFPLHPLVKEIMAYYGVYPMMVAPNSWCYIVGFISLCTLVGATVTVALFWAYHTLIFQKNAE